MSNKELNECILALNKHDGMRYEAVRYFVARMSVSDLKLITDFCIETERKQRENRQWVM